MSRATVALDAIVATGPMGADRDVEQLFPELYETHREAVYRLCLRYGAGRAAWAEDLTHDVFLKLLHELPSLESPDDVGGWLYRVTANLAISSLRRERSWIEKIRLFLAGERQEHEPLDEAAERQEASELAVAALEKLPGVERVVLSMKILDGKSQKEIAEALSLSEGYVSKLTARAWTRLRAAGWEGDDGRS